MLHIDSYFLPYSAYFFSYSYTFSSMFCIFSFLFCIFSCILLHIICPILHIFLHIAAYYLSHSADFLHITTYFLSYSAYSSHFVLHILHIYANLVRSVHLFGVSTGFNEFSIKLEIKSQSTSELRHTRSCQCTLHRTPAHFSRYTEAIPAAGTGSAVAPPPSYPEACSAIQAFHPFMRSSGARANKRSALISSRLMTQFSSDIYFPSNISCTCFWLEKGRNQKRWSM